MECSHHSQHSPTSQRINPTLSQSNPVADPETGNPNSPDLRAHEPPFFGPLASPPVEQMEEFIALCLLGKIWGEYVALPGIINKTRSDWKYIRGLVSYVDLGITKFHLSLLMLKTRRGFGMRDLGILMGLI